MRTEDRVQVKVVLSSTETGRSPRRGEHVLTEGSQTGAVMSKSLVVPAFLGLPGFIGLPRRDRGADEQIYFIFLAPFALLGCLGLLRQTQWRG